MKRIIVPVVLGLLIAAPVARVQADSLWSPNASSLFTDLKARKPGDVLTILISEQTQAVAQASTKTNKEEEASFGPGTGFLLDQIKKLGLSGNSNMSASGQTSRNGSLTGQITVTVKEVDANGNLVVEGVREVQINAEKQKMIFRGRVRPTDIGANNVVPSALVADATIAYEGKGPIGNKQREGIITRIFKILF